MRKLVLTLVKRKGLPILMLMFLFLLIQVVFTHAAINCGGCGCWCDDYDGGLDYFTASYVRHRNVRYLREPRDRCVSGKDTTNLYYDVCADANTLTEYSCVPVSGSGALWRSTNVNCQSGCSAGACVTPTDIRCRWQKCTDPPTCSSWVNIGAQSIGGESCEKQGECTEDAQYRGRVRSSGIGTEYTSTVYGQSCEIRSGSDLAWSDSCDSVWSCCSHYAKCVKPDGTCTPGWWTAYRVTSSGDDQISYCGCCSPFQPVWRDCDSRSTLCDGGENDCGRKISGCSDCWVDSGEAGVGEYASVGGSGCCGDDDNEYYITADVGPDKCCDSPTDCVDEGGVCRSGVEIPNGIDDDCDGFIDNCAAGKINRSKECAEGVCVSDPNEWACCDNNNDCVHIAGADGPCYRDATPVLESYTQEKSTECENKARSDCTGVCEWTRSCSLPSYYADICDSYSGWWGGDWLCGYFSYCEWNSGSSTCEPNPEACTVHTTSSACNAPGYCEWNKYCSLRDDVRFSPSDLKGSSYEDQVFEDVNTGLAGDEYCDPGEWHSELFKCTDTDHGRHYFANGTVTKSGRIETDECAYCTGLLPAPVTCGAVKEYYCEGNEIKSETYVCPDGCFDRACKCPAGQFFNWRVCAPGVCETNISDWKCTDSPTDCVYNLNRYMDADEAERLIGNETKDRCQNYGNDDLSCGEDLDCGFHTNACTLKEGHETTRYNIKNDPTYYDQVYLDFNAALSGDEYCDPGTWFSEVTSISGTVENLRGDLLEGARVTAISSGQPVSVYTAYTDDSGFYYITVTDGDINYDVSASLTDYLTETKTDIYAVEYENTVVDFELVYDSICAPDCSYFTDPLDNKRCHADCHDDPNGCSFYPGSPGAGEDSVCKEESVGFIKQFTPEPDKDIICCKGAPYSRMRAVASVNTTGNIVTIRKPVWYGGKLVNMVITFFD